MLGGLEVVRNFVLLTAPYKLSNLHYITLRLYAIAKRRSKREKITERYYNVITEYSSVNLPFFFFFVTAVKKSLTLNVPG